MFFEYDSNIFGRARVCHRNLRNKILTTDRPSDIYPGKISPELFELLSRSSGVIFDSPGVRGCNVSLPLQQNKISTVLIHQDFFTFAYHCDKFSSCSFTNLSPELDPVNRYPIQVKSGSKEEDICMNVIFRIDIISRKTLKKDHLSVTIFYGKRGHNLHTALDHCNMYICSLPVTIRHAVQENKRVQKIDCIFFCLIHCFSFFCQSHMA